MSLLTLVVWSSLVAADTEAKPEPRRFHEINRDLQDLLKKEATAPTQAERALAVCRLTVLYRELVTDPRLASSDALKEYKARLWHRLTKIKADIKRDLARGGGSKSPSGPVATNKPRPESETSTSASSSSAASESESAVGAAGGGARADWGQDLVDLIEATINPQFWDSNGGPGTIIYFQPLQALVVRATGETHRDLSGLLRALGR